MKADKEHRVPLSQAAIRLLEQLYQETHPQPLYVFYNQQRIQKGLDFKTPNQMAEDFYRFAA